MKELLNFYELISDILEEQGKSFKDLENDEIIKKRSFYRFKTYTPYLPEILKIANYLEVSLDYITGKSTKNYFKKYNSINIGFYNNLIKILEQQKITQTKISQDLKFGRSNFNYWKHGSFPKLNLLVDIANYLNCDIDDLLEHEN